MELCLALNNLRPVLFNNQPLLSGQLAKPSVPLSYPLHVFALAYMYVKVTYPLSCQWGIVDNVYIVYSAARYFRPIPLQVDQIFTEARKLLDEYFRLTIAGPSSMPIHLAFVMEGYVTRPLREIGNICNSLDRQRLRRFVDEHPYLIRIHITVEDKHVLRYYVPSFGCVTSLILIVPGTSIRPLWPSTCVKRPLKALSLTQILDLTRTMASYTSLHRR